jgi:DNA modification methylase
MRNKFNLLSSKEWLPFQKSWFLHTDDETLLTSNLRFFTKSDENLSKVYLTGRLPNNTKKILEKENLEEVESTSGNISFAYMDLRDQINLIQDKKNYEMFLKKFKSNLLDIFDNLIDRRFLCVNVQNLFIDSNYLPIAWDIGKIIGSIFSLKDEKIACINEVNELPNKSKRFLGNEFFYCLYFRKDEKSPRYLNQKISDSNLKWENLTVQKSGIPAWFILKPKPRKKDEILHPAKYPEELVEIYLREFTKPGDNIYDPMAGTGTTQVGALRNSRNGYGMELSQFFCEIANSRCDDVVNPDQESLFESSNNLNYRIINDDARNFRKYKFPKMDYVITSPPYWDMLNMKGAENQAKRIESGLKTNYSDDKNDLGNIENYDNFIEKLCNIYFENESILQKGAILTIVVKNIKKKGSNFPFAWDLAFKLQQKFILLPENFWLQDDISIAPFGYGNTWVSNTFHQYCLNFRLKPI